jgi:hypothetical protein
MIVLHKLKKYTMANKTVLKKEVTIKNKPADKKTKKVAKKSSALVASSAVRSAVGAVKAHSSRDVRGSSGLANTGTIISYD